MISLATAARVTTQATRWTTTRLPNLGHRSPLTASISLRAHHAKQSLPELSYGYDALEPHISKEIMETHHKKHHQAYVNGFNSAIDQLTQAHKDNNITLQIRLQQAIKFNGGGHVNHSIFWTNLAPPKGSSNKPEGKLFTDIESTFGSFEEFKTKFAAEAASVQGSGWAWLGYCKNEKRLKIATTPNQDPLLTAVPLLGIDVWEHAYYLQYKNVRPDYLKAIWNVINWENVASRYAAI